MATHKKATIITDVYKVVSPEPIMTAEDLDAFYLPEIIDIRGLDVMDMMKTRLVRAENNMPFKAFLMGHPGVGKSSALTSLIHDVDDKFQDIRFSARKQLDMINFKAFDVLLLTITELAERNGKPIAEGGSGECINDNLIRPLLDWFATTETSETKTREEMAVGGVGVDSSSTPWARLIGLKIKAYAEAKYAGARVKKTVEYRLSKISELVDCCNRIIDACNASLMKATGKQWLIIWEDFDKEGIPKTSINQLFLEYGHIFSDLNVNMITNIPVALGYSGEARSIIDTASRFALLDSPVFNKEHEPHEHGRKVLRQVVEKRMDTALFDEGVLDSLLVASGGNIRDLFYMIIDASDRAMNAENKTVGEKHAQSAIAIQRLEYARRLGNDRFSVEDIKFDDKIKRLKEIYINEVDSSRTDEILYALLRSRAVQEFNGTGWFGIHPLVVDYLISNKHIEETGKGSSHDGLSK